MARRVNPKRELEKLKGQQRDLAAAVKKAETRLHISLGKLVCETRADSIPEDQLRALLETAAAHGGAETLRLLRANEVKPAAQKKQAVDSAPAALRGE